MNPYVRCPAHFFIRLGFFLEPSSLTDERLFKCVVGIWCDRVGTLSLFSKKDPEKSISFRVSTLSDVLVSKFFQRDSKFNRLLFFLIPFIITLIS